MTCRRRRRCDVWCVHLPYRDAMERHPLSSPLLEFDDAVPAFIEPTEHVRTRDVPRSCVVTFFGDSVRRLIQSDRAKLITENAWEDGPHPLLELEHQGNRLAVLHSGVGAPLSAALLEEVIAMGCRAFIVCGGAGALRPEVTLGHFVVVESALRDEGTSHHYAAPSRYIPADPAAMSILTETLVEHGIPFITGRTWTTDAPYRETADKIAAGVRRGASPWRWRQRHSQPSRRSAESPRPDPLWRRRSVWRDVGSPVLADTGGRA